MKYILFIPVLFLLSCKKEEVKPIETCTVTSFVKSSNGTLKVFEKQFNVSQNYTETVEVTNKELSIKLNNNVKSLNDSISLSVTYNGVTKQKGLKCNNSIGTISIYISDF